MTTSRRPRPVARPSRPRRRRTPRRFIVRRLVAGFVAAVLVGVAAAAGLAHWGLAQIDRTIVAGLTSHAAAAEEPTDRATPSAPRLLNVLVVGNDSRDGMSARDRRAFGTGEFDGNRTDTIMLLQLEVGGPGRGAVLSFPRDLLVTRCDGSRGRINAAYGVGLERDGDGPSCVVETVTQLTGVDVHHYVEVSFAGFLEVVDALGGVKLYLDEPLYDEKAHLDVPAGCVRLAGANALGFVRARHLDNDFGRIARQQRFIKETLRQATDLGVLANPPKLFELVDAAAAAVHTDAGLGLAQMREIALGVRSLTADGLEVHTVPSQPTVSGGTWYVVEKGQAARRLYASFADGSIVRDGPPPPPDDGAPALPPVTVLNGTDTSGVAAAAARLVEAEGFEVADVGDAQLQGLDTTRILHPPAFGVAAARLARLFPKADVIEGVEGLPLTLKLGADADPEHLGARAAAARADRGGAATQRDPGEKGRAVEAEPAYRGASSTVVDC